MKSTLLGYFKWVGVSLLVLFISCNQSDDFGSGLLGDQFVDVDYELIKGFSAVNELTESVVTFDIATRIRDSSLLVSDLRDPIFGRTEAIAYSTFRFRFSPNRQSLGNVTCDSLVLDLRLARNVLYGDTMLPFNLSVHRLNQQLDFDSIGRSNFYPNFDPTPLGQIEGLLLKPTTRVMLPDSSFASPFLRLKLDPALGQELLDTPFAFDTAAVFERILRGLVIRAEGAEGSPLFGINILPRAPSTLSASDTKLRLFYSSPDTTGFINITAVDNTRRFFSLNHDLSGTVIEPTIGDKDKSSEFLFLQGLAGPRPRIILPELNNFDNKTVKVAVLEVAIAEQFPGLNSRIFPGINQLILSTEEEDGTRRVISDVTRFQTGGAAVVAAQFGGVVVPAEINGRRVNIYRMNITRYLQSYLEGKESGRLEMFIPNSDRRPERTVLYGPGHPEVPIQMKVIFTDI